MLYEGDPHNVDYDATVGWTEGQKIAGYRIDSSLAGASKAGVRLSRWDTWALSAWDDATDLYTVILRRPLNTGYADDLDMSAMDSVKVKVGITNNRDFSTTIGSSSQGLIGYFWIIL